jgi:hypothetical protein
MLTQLGQEEIMSSCLTIFKFCGDVFKFSCFLMVQDIANALVKLSHVDG